MIKVLHVVWSPSFGGIEQLVYDLALTQQGDPELRIGVLFGKAQGDFLEKFRSSGLPCYFAGLVNGYDFSPGNYGTALQIMSGFDVLHFHSFNPLLALAGVRARKKILFTEHGCFGFGRKRRISDAVNDAMEERFLRKHVSFISFNSRFTQQFAERRYHLEKANGKVIYNGMLFKDRQNTRDNVPASLREALQGKFVIGTTSRFAGFKRIDRLIEAFQKMQPNREVILLLVGDGPLRGQLEEAVIRAKLQDKVIFTGFQHNVGAYQQLMDVCVFPSQREPFGLVAIETLSLGKPVLVFRDGGGIVEVIEGVGPEDIAADVDELADRLAFYYQHPEQVCRKAAQRRAHAKKFNIQEMADSFASAYCEESPSTKRGINNL